ncbi:MAG: hemolysin III family protein [Clostridia bacterium]|nr:hemolysin III family protein [Clostridia bacterium]
MSAKTKRPDTQTPKRSVLEEVGNSVTHGVGALFAVAALVLMLLEARTANQRAGAVVYFTGLFLSMLASCLYHAFPHGSGVKRLFRRFDYISIYLLIGATFAPILTVFVGGTFGYVFLVVQWVVIVLGIVFVAVFGPQRFRWAHITGYIVLGWSGLLILPLMVGRSLTLLGFVLGGGIVYSLGIIPFALKKRGSHFIWHFFVLAGAVIQWLGIYGALYA